MSDHTFDIRSLQAAREHAERENAALRQAMIGIRNEIHHAYRVDGGESDKWLMVCLSIVAKIDEALSVDAARKDPADA
jgi:hypothetical protein